MPDVLHRHTFHRKVAPAAHCHSLIFHKPPPPPILPLPPPPRSNASVFISDLCLAVLQGRRVRLPSWQGCCGPSCGATASAAQQGWAWTYPPAPSPSPAYTSPRPSTPSTLTSWRRPEKPETPCTTITLGLMGLGPPLRAQTSQVAFAGFDVNMCVLVFAECGTKLMFSACILPCFVVARGCNTKPS